ncbi:MAG: type 4a pilus biogenesis protein PilO [Opitutae bacterium]|nr:type 4a pilus biogenesis protein PilO [Opitutae bacterium]
MNALLENFLGFVRRYPVVVASIVVILLLGGANYWLWRRHETLARTHEETRRKGEAMQQAISEHARLTAHLATTREAVTFIDQNLINEGDLAENLGYFYQMESISRVRLGQLGQLSSQPAVEGSPYKTIPFSLHVSGTYPQLIRFLRELEGGPRLVRVRTFGFNRADPLSGNLALDLSIEMLGHP